MRCPLCSSDSTRVVDSRLSEPGDCVRRRRQCEGCRTRFTTYERAEGASLGVRKRDGRREAYDRQKLLGGLMRAATKRPLSLRDLELVADGIEIRIRPSGGEIDAEEIGGLALQALRRLDPVAAIRFASVYRSFEGLDDFEAELRRVAAESAAPGPLVIGPVVDGADPPAIPSDAQSNMGRSPAASAAGRPKPRTTSRRTHAE